MKKRVRTASANGMPYGRRDDVGRHPLAVGQPAEGRRVGAHEPQGERHDADHPDAAEDRRRRGQAAVVDQPLGAPASARCRRPTGPVEATRQGDRSPGVVPAGDDRRHRDQPGAGEPERRRRRTRRRAASAPRPGRAAASDTPPRIAAADDGMRTSRRAMSRATHSPATPPTTKYSVVASEIDGDRPAPLVAERVEVDGQAVEAEARRDGQDDEAAGDDAARRGTRSAPRRARLDRRVVTGARLSRARLVDRGRQRRGRRR